MSTAFFAYVVVGCGAGMGLALGTQIFVSHWQMWIDLVNKNHRRNRREPLAWISHTIERIGVSPWTGRSQ